MNITSLGIEAIAQFIPIIIVSIAALWKENAVLFMIVAGTAIMTGLYAPDILNGSTVTTSFGISAGLAFIAYGLLSALWAFKLIIGGST